MTLLVIRLTRHTLPPLGRYARSRDWAPLYSEILDLPLILDTCNDCKKCKWYDLKVGRYSNRM